MQINLLIGLGAGLVSAMLFASASTGTVLGLFVLFFLSPMPVAIAGLGWGWRAAAAAAFAAPIAIATLGTPRGAIFHVLAIGAPTAILSYLALLNREVVTSDGVVATEWYPTGRIVAVAALIAGTLAAIGLLSTASDVDGLREQMRATAERVLVLSSNLPTPSAPAGTPLAWRVGILAVIALLASAAYLGHTAIGPRGQAACGVVCVRVLPLDTPLPRRDRTRVRFGSAVAQRMAPRRSRRGGRSLAPGHWCAGLPVPCPCRVAFVTFAAGTAVASTGGHWFTGGLGNRPRILVLGVGAGVAAGA